MNFNFELILFYAIILCGIIFLFDIIFLAKKRKQKTKTAEIKYPLIIDYARSFFPILLLVFLLRSFLFEPFRIPTGSLEPTLHAGDFILVNKFYYGIRLPILHTNIYSLQSPKKGDIIVFRYPPDESINYIKRVVGIPGDHISYIDKELYINGEKIPQTFVKNTIDHDEDGNEWNVIEKQENLLGVKHEIYLNTDLSSVDLYDIIVPPGMFFAMGDNRDHSADSRYWGFVPEKNIVGKASYIWLSWDSLQHNVRWNRFGKKII